MSQFTLKSWGLDSQKYTSKARLTAIGLWLVFFGFSFSAFAAIDLVRFFDFLHHQAMPEFNPHGILAFLCLTCVMLGLFFAYRYNHSHETGNIYFVAICMSSFLGTLLGGLVDFVLNIFFSKMIINLIGYNYSSFFAQYWISLWPEYLAMLLILILTFFFRLRLGSLRMDVQRKETSGNLGSAKIASESDINNYGLRSAVGGLLGKDRIGYLRLPKLADRLILAFRGGGKTSSILVPFLLDHVNTNKLVTDIKGELAAITVRKAIALGRKVFVIDPFCVLKSLNIPIQTHSLNPFAFINFESPLERDRSISALTSALCSSSSFSKSESEAHFAENSQIILEGVLEHFSTLFQEEPDLLNLVHFHDWWLEAISDPDAKIIVSMQESSSSKVCAAVSQLMSAGKNEAGSMKTTIYRQLQWLRSESVRESFVKNEVDLNEFVFGNCDIFVVLPEDMVQAYSRVVRVVMSILKVKLIQANAKDLHEDYVFVLDELGQFGYCPDIEQIINTMRARGVKVLASFQTISQIEAYKDPAVFKSMPVKQFLENDDLKTLEWIQRLGDKTTVLTENISHNTSKSHQVGSSSVSESRSISETSKNLIDFADIREMPKDEQYIFIRGMRPIRCKKAYYFNESIYNGRYDENPLET